MHQFETKYEGCMENIETIIFILLRKKINHSNFTKKVNQKTVYLYDIFLVKDII